MVCHRTFLRFKVVMASGQAKEAVHIRVFLDLAEVR